LISDKADLFFEGNVGDKAPTSLMSFPFL